MLYSQMHIASPSTLRYVRAYIHPSSFTTTKNPSALLKIRHFSFRFFTFCNKTVKSFFCETLSSMQERKIFCFLLLLLTMMRRQKRNISREMRSWSDETMLRNPNPMLPSRVYKKDEKCIHCVHGSRIFFIFKRYSFRLSKRSLNPLSKY